MISEGQLIRAAGAPCDCGCDDGCGLERVRFFPRQLLGADDLNTEQRYFKEKLRRHNRFLHGFGVVCGCEVRLAPTAARPLQVVVCPGYVIAPQGDEIMIACPALFDLASCMVTSDDPCAFARPCPPITSSTPLRSLVYLAVCYTECTLRPVRVAPVGCGCDDAQCDYSRIRDAYEFACLDSLPASHAKPAVTCDQLCQGAILPCPPCPPDNCVVLATIRIDVAKSTFTVDNLTDRRLLYGTAMVQEMAICTCRGHGAARPDSPSFAQSACDGAQGWNVTISSPTGSTVYYTIDGATPAPGQPGTAQYQGHPVHITSWPGMQAVTVTAVAVSGGVQSAPSMLAVPPLPQAAKPTITIDLQRARVTMATTEANGQIHYTIDGTDPTIASPVYAQPISFARGGTITPKAVAVAPCKLPSEVAFEGGTPQ